MAILSAPTAVWYWLGVGLWTTKRSASAPDNLGEFLGDCRDWFSCEERGEGVLCALGTSRVSWWPDSYDGRGGGLLGGGGRGISAGSSTAFGYASGTSGRPLYSYLPLSNIPGPPSLSRSNRIFAL